MWMRKLAWCALAIALIWQALPGLAQNQTQLSSDPRVNEARDLINRGAFAPAFQIMIEIDQTRADRLDVLFLTGLSAVGTYRQGIVNEETGEALLEIAIRSFHAMLVEDPGLVRARMELAQAFFLRGDDDLARQQFGQVLASRPPPVIAANIQRYLNAIRDRRRVQGFASLTVVPDTNFNRQSEEKTIYFFGLPFVLQSEKPKSGVGFRLRVGGEFEQPLGERTRFVLGGDITRTEYPGGDLDQTSYALNAGPRWLLPANTELDLRARVSRHDLGTYPNYWETAASATVSRRLNQRLQSAVTVSHGRRDFWNAINNDGPISSIALNVSWILSPTLRLNSGLTFTRERPNAFRNRNSARAIQLALSYAAPRGFTFGLEAGYQQTRYKGNWSPFVPADKQRKDSLRSLGLSVYNRGFTVFGFSPKLTLIAERQGSTGPNFVQKRNRGELHFEQQF